MPPQARQPKRPLPRRPNHRLAQIASLKSQYDYTSRIHVTSRDKKDSFDSLTSYLLFLSFFSLILPFLTSLSSLFQVLFFRIHTSVSYEEELL